MSRQTLCAYRNVLVQERDSLERLRSRQGHWPTVGSYLDHYTVVRRIHLFDECNPSIALATKGETP